MEKYYIGLDGGSTYLKAAMIKDKRVIDTLVRNTGIDNNGTAERLVAELCERNRVKREQVGYIMATGYSRKVLEVADDDISEITAHAYGVRLTAPTAIPAICVPGCAAVLSTARRRSSAVIRSLSATTSTT